MALFVGKDGSFRIGANIVGNIDKWDLSVKQAHPEITAFGDTNGMRAYGDAIWEWSGTASGTLDKADAQQVTLSQNFESTQIPATAALRLYWAPASYWFGSAWISQMSPNSKVDDKVSVSFSFTGHDILSASSSS